MPGSILEGNKSRSSQASDGLCTGVTLFGEQFTITINTIGIVWLIGFVCVFNCFSGNITCCKSLPGQGLVAVATIETIPMPGLITEGNAPGCNNLLALGAPGCVFVLVAFNAINIIIFGYKTIGANSVQADATTKTAIMPLLAAVLHLLGTFAVSCSERLV